MLRLLLLALVPSAAVYASVITGANGFVARHVVHSLLQHGDASSPIVCLVRPGKVEYEQLYWDAYDDGRGGRGGQRVKVMPYDMLDGGVTLHDALDAAMEDADPSSSPCRMCIYHIASVFGPTPDPVQTAHDNVKSAEDVVTTLDRFYQRHPNLKPRLVVTSSMAAVRATDQPPLNGKHYTHRDWNTLSKLNPENWGSCYQWSKAESERRAWKLVRECNEKYADEGKGRKMTMISLCPSFVFGPPPPMPPKMKDATHNPSGSSSYSLTLINQWLQGKSPVQSRLCADVRDVAFAHVAAGTLSNLPEEEADRRYILSTEERLSSEATAQALIEGVKRAQKSHGDTSMSIDTSGVTWDATFTGGAIKIGDREVEATERLERDLGVVCRPVEETMQDMAEALLYGETY